VNAESKWDKGKYYWERDGEARKRANRCVTSENTYFRESVLNPQLKMLNQTVSFIAREGGSNELG
jgi:hypothetical protein